MDRLLQFLTSESPLAWLIAGALLGVWCEKAADRG